MELFEGKTWVITGELTGITRQEATQAIEERGARVTSAVTARTDYLVSTRFRPMSPLTLSARERRAMQHQIPIFNEAQLLAILGGASAAEVEALGPATTPPTREIETREVLEGFRDLLYDEPSEATWEAICVRVEACSAADLPVVVDYVAGNIAGWPEVYDLAKLRHASHAQPLRMMPERWKQALFRGEDGDRLRLVRAVDLFNGRMDTKIGLQVLSCTNLCNVRCLDLSRNKLSTAFFAALRQAGALRDLTHLGLGGMEFNPAIAKALHGPSVLDGVEALSIAHATFKRDSLATFLGAPCWGELRVLLAEGASSETIDPLEALYAAPHIDELEVLDLGGVKAPTRAHVGRLGTEPRYAGLRQLNLRGAPFDEAASAAWRDAPWAAGLELLDLTKIPVTPALTAFLGSAPLSGVKLLRIGGGVEAACANPHLRPRVLVLDGALDARSLEALERSELLAGLEQLSVLELSTVSSLARVLRSPRSANLVRVHMQSEPIGAAVVEALIEGLHLGRLEQIGRLPGDDLTGAQIETLERADHLSPVLRQMLVPSLGWHARNVLGR